MITKSNRVLTTSAIAALLAGVIPLSLLASTATEARPSNRASGPVAGNRAVRNPAGRDIATRPNLENGNGRDIRRRANVNINNNSNNNINISNNGNYNRHNGWGGNGGWYDDHHHWHPLATAATVAVTAAVIGSIVNSVPSSGCQMLIVNGLSYYQCGSSWYQPRYYGSNVQYIVVVPPR
jgi:hypothetical protein